MRWEQGKQMICRLYLLRGAFGLFDFFGHGFHPFFTFGQLNRLPILSKNKKPVMLLLQERAFLYAMVSV
jgi:hypothetical protein